MTTATLTTPTTARTCDLGLRVALRLERRMIGSGEAIWERVALHGDRTLADVVAAILPGGETPAEAVEAAKRLLSSDDWSAADEARAELPTLRVLAAAWEVDR